VVAALVVRHNGRWNWPYILLVAGSLGNLMDRLLRGSVTDFLRIPHWPAFNLADIFIVTGVLILVKSLIFQLDQPEEQKAAEQQEKVDTPAAKGSSPERPGDGREKPPGQENADYAALRP
jgi:signal peptidase II